jgi:hypothetical protein
MSKEDDLAWDKYREVVFDAWARKNLDQISDPRVLEYYQNESNDTKDTPDETL